MAVLQNGTRVLHATPASEEELARRRAQRSVERGSFPHVTTGAARRARSAR